MKKIDRYEILDELGHGGMGTVFRAVDPRLDRIVAIKTIRTDSDAAPVETQSLLDRFRIEARAAAGLAHPNIVVIYDYGEHDKRPYIVMEFIEGISLDHLMKTSGPLAVPSAMRILTETAKALDHAHSKGVLHRDVKPGNLMIRQDGVLKLTDFGIARISGLSGVTQTGFIVGSPHYLSPESFRSGMVDARSDQYSLGVLAWELLTGVKPFSSPSVEALMFEVVFGDRPIITKVNRALTPESAKVFQKVLAVAGEDRYQSCGAFVDSLGEAVSTSCVEKVWSSMQNSVESGTLELFMRTYPGSTFAEAAKRPVADRLIADSEPKPPAVVPVQPQSVNPGSVLVIAGRPYPVLVGERLFEHDVPGLKPAGAATGEGVVAEINVNPKNPSMIGLKNLSTSAWIRTSASGEVRIIDPGKSVHLAAGSTIQFGASGMGATEGKVQ